MGGGEWSRSQIGSDPAHPTASRVSCLARPDEPQSDKRHERRRSWRDHFAKIPMARYRPAVARRGTRGMVKAGRNQTSDPVPSFANLATRLVVDDADAVNDRPRPRFPVTAGPRRRLIGLIARPELPAPQVRTDRGRLPCFR